MPPSVGDVFAALRMNANTPRCVTGPYAAKQEIIGIIYFEYCVYFVCDKIMPKAICVPMPEVIDMTGQHAVSLPSEADVEQARESSRTLSKYADVDRVQLSLRGSNGETDDLVLPGNVLQILLDVLSEMSRGNAISLIPQHQELSTQEAANLLNVSRPFLVGLLEKGAIPFRKVGAHRRVLLTDIMSYREKTTRRRTQALDELTSLSQDEDMGY